MFDYKIIRATGQKYYFSGKDPRLLITSGIHGDEFEIIPALEKLLQKYQSRLPGFLFIPEASPSALAAGRRKNSRGLDLNRCFSAKPKEPEAVEIVRLLKPYKFPLFVSFHEDATQRDFYFYEYDHRRISPDKINQLGADLRTLGINLWEGIDDPHDPDLNNPVYNGYCYPRLKKNDVSLEGWVFQSKKAGKVILPEIPGLIPKYQKAKVADLVFRRLILDF